MAFVKAQSESNDEESVQKKRAARRERKLPPEFIKQFIEAYDIKNTDDIKVAMADMLGITLQGCWKANRKTTSGTVSADFHP